MDKIRYIVVPAGELKHTYWQTLMAGPDGYKIVCIALMLRDLAVESNMGGLICHPNGEPLTLLELALALRVDGVWLEPVLRGPLSRVGNMREDDNGGWVCQDTTTIRHFSRINKLIPSKTSIPVLELEGEQEEETAETRKLRQGRNRKRKYEFRRRWGVEPTCIFTGSDSKALPKRDKNTGKQLQNARNAAVTQHLQLTEITDKNSALPYNNKKNKNIKKTTTPYPQTKRDGGGDFLEKIFKTVLQKYGRQDLVEHARNAVQGRDDITAPLQFITKVIENKLEEEVKAKEKQQEAQQLAKESEEWLTAVKNSEENLLKKEILEWRQLEIQQKQLFIQSITPDHFLAPFKNDEILMAAEWGRVGRAGVASRHNYG